MFVFDAGYDPIALTHALADVRATIVVRIRDAGSSTPTRPCPHPARSADRGATAPGSAAPTRPAGPTPTTN
jgi:hypothetical protein